MSAIIVSSRNKFRLMWIVWLFLVIGLFCSFAHSWRITQKCPHGHYFNDGCTACWCDILTGQTKCEKLLQCRRTLHQGQVQCPNGRQFKDSCGNDCTCFESSGTVLCNEIRKCPQDAPIMVDLAPLSTPIASNVLVRRSGIAAPYIPPVEEHPIRLGLPVTTPFPPIRSSSTLNPTPGSSRNYEFYENNVAIASTPHPHIRIPSNSRSEELIIEPAIIIRKKGSNKASIVRNPSSATSVTLPSPKRRNQGHTFLINKSNNKPSSSYISTPKSAPLQLYEKQLQTIMNIRRAYAQLLRAKVNFNFQIAAGKNPVNAAASANQYSNVPSSTDHPRRFDINIDNTPATPGPSLFQTTQQSTMPQNIQVNPFQPLIWKNVFKQFSPVPPLKHMVSYVSTTTENYLKDFLNRNRLQNVQKPVQAQPFPPDTTTPAPYQPVQLSTPPTTPRPPSLVSYPFHPFSTIEPFHEQQFDPSTIPIHEVYQNHNFKMLSTSSTPRPSYHSPTSYLQKVFNNPTYRPNNVAVHQPEYKKEHFPYMNDLMHEIARMDSVPNTTPRYSPTFTALPTFQTPGPPYAEIEEVQPLSFLPPPQPEPATPTRKSFMMGEEGKHPPPIVHQSKLPVQIHPTVRVNLDKPIYINQPVQQSHYTFHQKPQNSYSQIFQHSHPHQPQHSPPRFSFPPPQQSFPQGQNRKVYSIPARPPSYATVPHQQSSYLAQPLQRHHHQHNFHHRPTFPQYFIPKPKPKQYRLVLKGPIREAAVRVDDVVPRFVNKIAHEFFKKPEIYVPKIRPGKPLTLERVVLNHKEIVPSEMNFSPTPGAPTKLRFTPQAQWDMKEEMSKQGVILNEPLPIGVHDFVANDPNVMEMDAPFKAVNTWERHSTMGMDAIADHFPGQADAGVTHVSSIPEIIQHATSQPPLQFGPILLPSPTPTPQGTPAPTTLDHQHQQEIQHQILLAQHQLHEQQQQQLLQQHQQLLQQQQQQQQHITSSGSNNHYKYDFKFDPGDFNDFKHDESPHDILPQELQIPGVEQVVVDKYVVHDPSDPTGALQMYSTTTVQPPVANANLDLPSQLRRNGLSTLPVQGPTPAPAVLVRHHGAPSPSTPQPTEASFSASSYPINNYLVTVIHSTPLPMIAPTISPVQNLPTHQIMNTPAGEIGQKSNTSPNIASQIHDFLAEQMDFGARPQLNLYDMLLRHRVGENYGNDENSENQHNAGGTINSDGEDDTGTVKHDEYLRHSHDGMEDLVATESKMSHEDHSNMDTDSVAKIFSLDYKSKYNKKPPAVIVIKVPPDHSDGPFPKVIEKRRGEETEIQAGNLNSKGRSKAGKLNRKNNDDYEDASMESSINTSSTTIPPTYASSLESTREDEDNESITSSKEESSSAKRRRNRKNRKRKRRRRKKKNRNKSNFAIDEEERNEDSGNENVNSQEIKSSDRKSDDKDKQYKTSKTSREEGSKLEETVSSDSSHEKTSETATNAEEKFHAELDWKSQLMANICDLNPSSPLCLTYRSICLLMTSEDQDKL